jgi:hypothetical protein
MTNMQNDVVLIEKFSSFVYNFCTLMRDGAVW